jgi:hypothetical protein
MHFAIRELESHIGPVAPRNRDKLFNVEAE